MKGFTDQNQGLIATDFVLEPKQRKSPLIRKLFFLAFFAAILYLTVSLSVAFVDTLGSLDGHQKFTAMGVVHGSHNRTYVFRTLFDGPSNRFRIDTIQVAHHRHHDNYENAMNILSGSSSSSDKVARPVTGLFLPQGIYAIYKNNEGNPACRAYKNPHPTIPDWNPLDGATDDGLTYLGPHLTHLYSDLKLPHGHGMNVLGLTDSKAWIRPFSGYPLQLELEGTFSKGGHPETFWVKYTFLRFFPYVDGHQLSVPLDIHDLCHPGTGEDGDGKVVVQQMFGDVGFPMLANLF